MMFPMMILAIENEEDRLFMQTIYEDYRRMMYAEAHGILGEGQNAEDVVSNAFLALINKISLLHTLGCYALRSYIVVTVRHMAIDLLRKQKRENLRFFLDGGEVIDEMPVDQTDVDVDMIRREEIERVKKGISQLREADQRLLEMKYVRDLTNAEIAGELGVDKNSVPSYLMRVRRRAYAALVEVNEDDD